MIESQLEAAAIKNFVLKHRRERYLQLLQTRKVGAGFGELDHFTRNFTRNLDLRFCFKIPSGPLDREITYILNKVQEYSNTTQCYLLSASPSLDGQWLTTKEALHKIIGSGFGSLLILEYGRIIFYESEEIKDRYLGIKI